jgi:hypothetical protein
MIVTLTDDAGQVHDVTAHFRLLFDTCVNSLDWGSGFLDFEETSHIIEAGLIAGFDVSSISRGVAEGAPLDLAGFREWAAAMVESMRPVPPQVTQPEPDVTVTRISDNSWQIQNRRAPHRNGFVVQAPGIPGQWRTTVHTEHGMVQDTVSGPFSDAYSRVTAALQRDLGTS